MNRMVPYSARSRHLRSLPCQFCRPGDILFQLLKARIGFDVSGNGTKKLESNNQHNYNTWEKYAMINEGLKSHW